MAHTVYKCGCYKENTLDDLGDENVLQELCPRCAEKKAKDRTEQFATVVFVLLVLSIILFLTFLFMLMAGFAFAIPFRILF